MTFARPDHFSDLDTLPQMHTCDTSVRAEATEDVPFLSGAALCHLHLVLRHEDARQALLREQMAQRAAEACVAYSKRPERAGELHDPGNGRR